MTHIHVRTGSEGPRHDPYHYEEVTVQRPDGRKVTLHVGLGVWAEAENAVLRERTDSPQEAYHMFERYAGVPVYVAERAYRSLPMRRLKAHPCGLQHIVDVNGFPGETLTVCGKCGHVVDSHFDRSAIE